MNKKIRLDKQQKQAQSEVVSSTNLFITGTASIGKTELLKRICEDLRKQKKVAAVLAPTGIAAENAKGHTMHNFLQLPLKLIYQNTRQIPGYIALWRTLRIL